MDVAAQLANKFKTVDDKLEFLTREINLYKSFLKLKFQREFEEFLCQRFEGSESSDSDDEDSPNVSFADSSNSAESYGFLNTSSTSYQDEQCEDFEEKFRPSGFGEPSELGMFDNSNSSSGGTSADETPSSSSNAMRSLRKVEEDTQGNLPECQFEASDSSVSDDEDSPNFSVAADAGLLNCAETEETPNGLQRTTSTSQQDEQCEDIEEKFRPSELVEPESVNAMTPRKNYTSKEIASDLEFSTSRRLQYSNLPSGSTSTAAVPSCSSNNAEPRTHPEDKCDDGEGNIPKLRSPMQLRKRRRNETEQEQIPTTKGPRQTTLDGGCENLQESDEDGEASLASAGTSVDSSSSKDFESDSETKRSKGFGRRKTTPETKEVLREPTPSRASNFHPHQQNHAKGKRFKCSVCAKRFLQASCLRRHEMIHTNEKPFECSYCEKSFRRQEALREHESIHTNEKSHECSVCKKTFRLPSNLRRHKLIHTSEKPYACSYCEKPFRHSGTLRDHELIHKNEKPHMCSVCGESFRHMPSLRKHKLIHSSEKQRK